MGLPWWFSGKESACNAGFCNGGLISTSGRSPGEGNGNPLQYSCQDNLMDRGAWRAMVHGVANSQTDTVCVPVTEQQQQHSCNTHWCTGNEEQDQGVSPRHPGASSAST